MGARRDNSVRSDIWEILPGSFVARSLRESRDCVSNCRWFQSRLKGLQPVNDAYSNEMNANPTAGADAKRGFDMPLFAIPGVYQNIAEQSMLRAKENCEKMKAASGEIADILKEACSTNAKGAADYVAKLIEISGANTSSALEFLTHLMGTKSLPEIIQLSATHGRKNFEVTSAQNKELWELTQEVAKETAEPIRKSLARVLRTGP
ncbi:MULTISPECIES: phasin [unclassified Bradyrhizobium]